MKEKAVQDVRRIIIIIVCAFVMALNIKTFVRTGDLFPGGATGLTLLIQQTALTYFGVKLPYSIINVLLNAFPIYIGFRYIGKKFTMASCLMIFLSSFLTDLIPGYAVTQDILLISIFGGIINGFVISICLLSNATTGGTDFISIYLSDRRGVDSFNIILGFNAAILCAAGFLFGWDKALYSIIFQFVSTQVLHVTYRNYQRETLLIVTEHPDEICTAISDAVGHGATIMHGEGAYGGEPRSVVYSVISRSDHGSVMRSVRLIDPKAFTNVMPSDELR